MSAAAMKVQRGLGALEVELLSKVERKGLVRGAELLVDFGPQKAGELTKALRSLNTRGYVQVMGPAPSPRTVFDSVYTVRPSDMVFVKEVIAKYK